MPSSDQLPRFTALLFGLSGGLVDFGARTLSLALRSHPHSPAEHLRDASLLPFAEAQSFLLRRKPNKSERQRLEQALDEAAEEQAEAITGAVALLESLDEQRIPYAWQDELPESVCQRLAAPLGRADALIPRRRAPLAGPRWLLAGPRPAGHRAPRRLRAGQRPTASTPGRTQCRAMDHRPGRQRAVVRPLASRLGRSRTYRARPLARRRHPGTVPPGRAFRDRSPGRAATLPARPRRPPPERRKP